MTSRRIAQNLQCVYHVKQTLGLRRGVGQGDFISLKPSVNVKAPTGSGINRGDSGGPIVWTGSPDTVIGVLSTGEIGANSFGNRANYMNLENPSPNAIQTLCLAFQDYAWQGDLSPKDREPGGEWLKSRCEKDFRPIDPTHPTRMIFLPKDAGSRENPPQWNPPRSERNPSYRFPYSPPVPQRDWFLEPIPMPQYELYDPYYDDDEYESEHDDYWIDDYGPNKSPHHYPHYQAPRLHHQPHHRGGGGGGGIIQPRW